MPTETEEQVPAETPEPTAEAPAAEAPAAEPAPSLADAITAGIESAPERGPKQPVEEGAAEPEGEEGATAGEGEEKEDAKDAAEGGGKKPEDKEGDKDPDHLNDPVPKEWSVRARERITSLVSTVKEKDQIIDTQGSVIAAIHETGASAEQFAGIIGYLRNLNSSDPANLEQCLKDMDNMRRNIAMRLGKPVDGIDFLAEHPDLQQEVKYGQITQARAQEIALSRERVKTEEQVRSRSRETDAQKAAAQKEQDAAQSELNELGEVLSASDPQYKAKYDAVMPGLIPVLVKAKPSEWRSMFLKAYRAAKVAAAPAPAAPAPDNDQMVRDPVTGQFVPRKKPQPIRPVAPSGTSGSKAAPKSLREAIDFSLAGDGN